MGVPMGPLQLFVDTAGMVAVIDSVIGGVFAAVVLDALGLHAVPVDPVAGVLVKSPAVRSRRSLGADPEEYRGVTGREWCGIASAGLSPPVTPRIRVGPRRDR